MSKIFVVEDNPEMRLMMRALLTGAGHEVIEAEDGSDVLLRSLEEEPDLVMLDVMIPVVDGWAPWRLSSPITALTISPSSWSRPRKPLKIWSGPKNLVPLTT